MEIRKATLEDVNELAMLFDAYRVFYQKPTDITAAKVFLTDRITQNESVIFITLKKDSITGFAQLYPLFSSTRMKRLWLLNDLFVKEEFRGQGFSVALLERTKAFCKETNACGFMLETAKTNIIGNQLYPKAGMQLDADHNYYS